MKRQKREINTSLLDQVTADMLGGEGDTLFQDDSLRVEQRSDDPAALPCRQGEKDQERSGKWFVIKLRVQNSVVR